MAAGILPTREQRRQLARENAKLPAYLRQVPPEQWPPGNSKRLFAVWQAAWNRRAVVAPVLADITASNEQDALARNVVDVYDDPHLSTVALDRAIADLRAAIVDKEKQT